MPGSTTVNPPRTQSRTPGPEHERLRVFVGTWTTKGQTAAAEGTPASPIASSDEYDWLPGGFFVVHRWNGTVGDAGVHGIEIIGYDPANGRYRTHFFDNDGNAGSEDLTVSGRTWSWVGRHVMGSDWHRCTSVVSDDGNTMEAAHERSVDGESWSPWMKVTLQRVA